ncbi:unnamed protein product [Heterobilharzia americana]|nr:unnamed protein product [Heterobilharzia americana]
MIFLNVVDWIMQETVRSCENMAICCLTGEKTLADLDFANDDSCLMLHKIEDLHPKTNKLTEKAAKTGLHMNAEKTEVMKIPKQQQQQQQAPITINGRNLK